MLAKSYNYDLVPYVNNNNNKEEVEVENGFIRVNKISSNFILIKKNVFEKISQKFETIRYQNVNPEYNTHPKIRDYFFSFFEYKKDLTSNIFMTSDDTFCKRWEECGGKIWVDLHCNLNVTSEFTYRGAVLLSIQNDN